MSARTHTSRYTWQAPNQQLWPGDMSVRLTVMLKEFTSTNTQIILHIIGFTFTQNKSCSVSQSFFFLFFPQRLPGAVAPHSVAPWGLSFLHRTDVFSIERYSRWVTVLIFKKPSVIWVDTGHATQHTDIWVCFRVQTTTARQPLRSCHIFFATDYSSRSKNKTKRMIISSEESHQAIILWKLSLWDKVWLCDGTL